MLTRTPLPNERMQPREHARAVEERRSAFALLDRAATRAVEVWSSISDAIIVLNPEAKAEDRVVRLESSAAISSMDWHGIETECRATTWRIVKLLHSVEYHGIRDMPTICAEHVVTELGFDEKLGDESPRKPEGAPWEYGDPCWKCANYWRGFTFAE